MNEQTVNGEVILTVPEGFKVLNEQEVKAWVRNAGKDHFVMRNEPIHSAIIIAWKKTNFLNKNASLAKVLDNTRISIKRVNPSYNEVENINTVIDGKEAGGFRYTYSVQNIEQTGEYILVKHNNIHYSFTCIGRNGMFDDNYHFFEEVLRSVKFK